MYVSKIHKFSGMYRLLWTVPCTRWFRDASAGRFACCVQPSGTNTQHLGQ